VFELSQLFPLLGWFYVSLFAVTVGIVYVRNRSLRQLFFLPFIFSSIFGIVTSHLNEWSSLPTIWKEWNQSSGTKMDNYAGSYRMQYLETFFPVLKKQRIEFVSVVGIDPREFLYVRMYLYPILVRAIDLPMKDDRLDSFIIVDKSKVDILPAGNVLVESQGKVLLQLTGGR